jgi:parallel beta-helix repeat protein
MSVQAGPILEVPTNDYPTIQKAINNASDGATIFVHNGTYSEDIVVNKSVSLIGENRDYTIIQGSSYPFYSAVYVRTGNVIISDFTIMKDTPQIATGLSVASNNNIIRHNRFMSTYYGMSLYSSSNNTVSDNIISGNEVGASLYLSDGNVFSGNVVLSNEDGLTLLSSSSNVFSGNALSSNGDGLSLSSSSRGNVLYHNNFHDTIRVSDDSLNVWDSGGEGNYWINYTGQDLNGDGIGDEPYPVGGTSRDNYPLMGAFSDFSVVLKNETHHVTTISNSSISSFRFETGGETGNKIIRFNVSDKSGSIGFCRIMIPTDLMGYPFIVLDSEEEIAPTLLNISDESHAHLYFTYVHGSQTISIISSVTLRHYNELLEKYIKLQNDLYALNVTFGSLLSSYSASLQAAIDDLNTTYHSLLNNYSSSMQASLSDLNSTYRTLLNNYIILADNYTRLLQDHQALDSSYQEHLRVFSEDAQNLRNLIYIFAALTGVFLVTTVYLSRRVHGKKQDQD